MPTTTEVRALPTAADANEIQVALWRAFDLLENVHWALNAARSADDDYPQPVTFETIGVVAEISDTLHTQIEEFQRFANGIRSGLHALMVLRSVQEGRINLSEARGDG